MCPSGALHGGFEDRRIAMKAEEDVAGGEKRGQRVSGAARPAGGRFRVDPAVSKRGMELGFLRAPGQLDPAETRCRACTAISHSGPK